MATRVPVPPPSLPRPSRPHRQYNPDSSNKNDPTIIPEHEHMLSITHKDFDPKKYLAYSHQNASFRDLEYELSQLDGSNEQQAESMRKLVREHFDEFVMAKATVDDAFRGWMERELDPATHYGTDAFSDTLAIATDTAQQVFSPILTRRSHADRIKSTLTVLERFKFFFNLPSTLRAHIHTGRWDAAVRDYKKGRALISAMYPDICVSSTGSTITTNNPTSIRGQQRMLFESIWLEVMRVIGTLQEQLIRQLTEQHSISSVDEQETAIKLVLEIDPTSDPVWVYLESRFKWILSQLKERVSMWYREMPMDLGKPERFTNAQFRRAVRLRNKKDYDVLFEKDAEVQTWSARTKLIADLTQCLMVSLPDFWKLSKEYIEGKYQPKPSINQSSSKSRGINVGGTKRGFPALDLAKVELCHRMIRDMTGYFGTLIQHALSLTPLSTTSTTLNGSKLSPVLDRSSISPSSPTSPGSISGGSLLHLSSLPQLPELTAINTVTVAVYAPRIIDHMHAFCDSAHAITIPPDTLTTVITTLDRCKAGLLDKLISAWNEDACKIPTMMNGCNSLEDQTNIPAFINSVTPIIPLFARFQKGIIQTAYKLSRPLTEQQLNSSDHLNSSNINTNVPSQKLSNLIIPAFFETVSQFLDGIHILVTKEPDTIQTEVSQSTTNQTLSYEVTKQDQWDRISLQVVYDIDHFDRVILPDLMNIIERLIGTKLKSERSHMTEIVKRLDSIVMNGIIDRTVQKLNQYISHGFSEVDWITMPTPTEIRPWVYRVLLELVNMHALIISVYEPLTYRVFSLILTSISHILITNVRRIDNMSQGAVLQVTTEVKFIHQTLCKYESQPATESLNAIYATCNELDPALLTSTGGKTIKSVTETEVVKMIVSHAMQATSLQFACFTN